VTCTSTGSAAPRETVRSCQIGLGNSFSILQTSAGLVLRQYALVLTGCDCCGAGVTVSHAPCAATGQPLAAVAVFGSKSCCRCPGGSCDDVSACMTVFSLSTEPADALNIRVQGHSGLCQSASQAVKDIGTLPAYQHAVVFSGLRYNIELGLQSVRRSLSHQTATLCRLCDSGDAMACRADADHSLASYMPLVVSSFRPCLLSGEGISGHAMSQFRGVGHLVDIGCRQLSVSVALGAIKL
jgi:hypothetical protein